MDAPFFKKYEQNTDEIKPVSHECTALLADRSTTLTTAEAIDIDGGLSITSEAQTTAGWSALVSAASPGDYTFRLALDYADGVREELKFMIRVRE